MNRLLHTALLLLVGLGGLGTVSCIVTDELSFSDRINYPPEIVSIDPPNTVVNFAENNDEREFTVRVWDPDADDLDSYAGRISLIENPYSAVITKDTRVCDPPTPSDTNPEETGVLVTVKCKISIQPSNTSADLIFIQVEVSDRGYTGGNILAEDAKFVRVNWPYELLPEGATQ